MADGNRTRSSIPVSPRNPSPSLTHDRDFAAIAKMNPPIIWNVVDFYRVVTSPESQLHAFISGDVRDIACYTDGYLLMRIHIQNEGVPTVWLRAEKQSYGPDAIQFSTDRSKLWKPSDRDIMATIFAGLDFHHVIDLLNDLASMIGLDPRWYTGVAIDLLHVGFGGSWVKRPPPGWNTLVRNVTNTEFMERQFAIRHPNVKKVSFMEPGPWKNEPASLYQPPRSKQDGREGADSHLADMKEKTAHPDSALGLSEEHLQGPHSMQSPNANGAVAAPATNAEKNDGYQPRGPGINRDNVLSSKPVESPTPYDLHHRSISQTRNPLSSQANGRQSMQPTNPSSISTPKEASTGIDKATSILQGAVITAPSTEALGQGPPSPSFANPQPSPPQTRNLTGRIVRLGSLPMATGGYSSVWRGRLFSTPSNNTGQTLQVAIKVLRASYTDEYTTRRKLHKRLHVEMRIWAKLHHENVVRLLGHIEDPDGPGLVSILYPHGNVVSFLVKNPSVNREIICVDVALGLQYLHEHKPRIVHGDLKGPNVLIDGEGRARICDFGLSIILDGSPTGYTSSNFGGSLRFLAPELLEESTRSVLTDIYAYACTCISILFDKEPYHELSKEAHLMRAILNHQPPFEPLNEEATFPSFWQILKRCWHHDRMNRPSLNIIVDAIQRGLYRTYRTNMGIHQGIGRRVRFICLPGIKEAKLISVADRGLSIVVNSSSSFYRVPIYQRYRCELMDRENLKDPEDDSDVSWLHEADHQYSPFTTFTPLPGDFASSETPPYVSKWRDYSAKFRFPYSLMVSYEPYNKATSETA